MRSIEYQGYFSYELKTNKQLSSTFENETQNRLILGGLLWLGESKK